MAAAGQDPAPRRFFIGIDFGTTFSGAFVMPDSRKPGGSIMCWPRTQAANIEGRLKTPTRLSLPQSDQEARRWGFEVSDEEDSFQWFKLGLMHQDDLRRAFAGWLDRPSQLLEAEDMQYRHETSATDLAKTYLRHLWERILEETVTRFGAEREKILELALHVVIGVPANWNRAAVDRLRHVVEEARIPGYHNHSSSLRFCIEPEAASMALVGHYQLLPDLASDDIFTVCDCGGGTADAVSYRTVSTQPFRVEECVPGKAEVCGPVLLDCKFRELLKRNLKTVAALSTLSQESIRDPYLSLWENGIKRKFDGGGKTWSAVIAVPRGGQRGALRTGFKEVAFTNHELKKLFDPTVDKIKELLRGQVKKVVQQYGKLPKFVIVCGGFSGNPYLQKSLSDEIQSLNQEHANGQLSGAMRFEVPHTGVSQQAVALGCAMRAFAENCQDGTGPHLIRVVSRVSRATYGVRSPQGFRQLVTEGDRLLMGALPRLRLGPGDFQESFAPSALNLEIFWGKGPRLEPSSVTVASEMAWTGGKNESLRHALQGVSVVELTIASSGDAVEFALYIDGEQQTPGDGFAVKHIMYR